MSNEPDSTQSGKLHPDSSPVPPRIVINNHDHQNVSQDQANKKKSDVPAKEKNSSKSNSSKESTKHREPRKPKSKKYSNVYITGNVVTLGTTTYNNFNLNNYLNGDTASGCEYENMEEPIRPMPFSIQVMANKNIEISTHDMNLIKTHIGKNWKNVVKKLGYTAGQIDQYIDRYKKNSTYGEVVYRILEDWKQNKTRDATIGQLIIALWSSRQYECAEVIEENHNTI